MRQIAAIVMLVLVLGLMAPNVLAGGDKNMIVHTTETGGDLDEEIGTGPTETNILQIGAQIPGEDETYQERPGVAQN